MSQSAENGYTIRVVPREVMATLRRSDELRGYEWIAAGMRRCAESGEVLFVFRGNSFDWECPGCGGILSGQLADTPVSGWDQPRWVRSGDDEHATLTPSLGCSRWRTGDCIGHWWAKDGRLTLA